MSDSQKPIDYQELENRFAYHPPVGDQWETYQLIREHAHQFALTLTTCCPASRELSLALTNLEQAVMWGNAAIARHPTGG